MLAEPIFKFSTREFVVQALFIPVQSRLFQISGENAMVSSGFGAKLDNPRTQTILILVLFL